MLIDPTDRDPEEFISYDWGTEDAMGNDLVFIVPRGDSAEGRKTKDVLGLNRETLCTDRGKDIDTLKALAAKMLAGLYLRDEMLNEKAARIVDAAAQQIAKETSAERQFAGFRRDFFRKHNLEKYISTD